MTKLFRDFATSTSSGRTAQLTRMCLVCGSMEISTVEVNGFNEWSFKKEYPGKHGYTAIEAYRHENCIRSGRPDYSFAEKVIIEDRDLAHEADLREELKALLAAEECDDDELDLDFED